MSIKFVGGRYSLLKQLKLLYDVQYYIRNAMPTEQTTLERLNQLQRQLIVHSFIYYELDNNIWSDNQFDMVCIEAEKAKKETPQWKDTQFFDVFENWDSSSGMSLIRRDDYKYYSHFRSLAYELIHIHPTYG